METLSLSDGTSRLDIGLVRWDGDAYITIEVDSRGFCGRNDLHVLGAGFSAFCRNLLVLQETLQGKATLSSVVDRELDLTVARSDALGHISVTGSTGYEIEMNHTSFWHSVHFGFQLEPNRLDICTRIPWVREYAA
ncbi:MAG: hypothetical protein QNJ73_07700 [Gammaproteobacteria bacterium]|nr:hypothetical protein [Gammaproteobacteria bacterium]